MKEITEDYVSFETAKLLKEKGFDWEDSPFYSEQDRDEWQQNNSYTVPNEEYNPELPFDSETLTMVAPHISLQMTMKWLREVHNIDIDIDAHCGMLGIKCYGAYISTYKPYKLTDTDKECGLTENDVKHRQIQFKRNTRIPSKSELIPAHEYFDTYEDACGAAIKYCLENLI